MMNPKLYCFQCMRPLQTENQTCPHCGYDNRNRTNGVGQLPFCTVKTRYLIGKCLGRGGFGITYIGLDLSLERRVALKEFFPTDLVSREPGQSVLVPYDEESRTSFQKGIERALQEARTIAKLPDVQDAVDVYDVFIANDTLCLVMEYIDGETLRQRMERAGGRLPPQQLLQQMRPIFTALKQIHSHSIIHRDVSPDNIMFRNENGRAVLLDFGAAHRYSPEVASHHSTSLRPGYAPVEQYSRVSLQDARTDEYALCATLYCAITGQKPCSSLERAFGDVELLKPSALGIAMDPAAETALMKGLSVQASDRYLDIAALENAIYGGSENPDQPIPVYQPLDADKTQIVATIPDAATGSDMLSRGATSQLSAQDQAQKSTVSDASAETRPDQRPVADGDQGSTPGKPHRELSQIIASIVGIGMVLAVILTLATLNQEPAKPLPKNTPDAYTLTVTPNVAPTPASTPQGTVIGTVSDYNASWDLNGLPIYQAKDGWQYVLSANGHYTLWGLSSDSSPFMGDTLTLPSAPEAYPTELIARGFSERVPFPEKVKTVVIPKDMYWVEWCAFEQFTNLEAIRGGENVVEMEFYRNVSHQCPLFLNNLDQQVMLGDGLLLHAPVIPGKTMIIPAGTKYISSFAATQVDEKNEEVRPKFASVILPEGLKKIYICALDGFTGNEVRLPDGVIVDQRAFGYFCNNLTTIYVGKDVTFNYGDAQKAYKDRDFQSSFYYVPFSGILCLEDGATLPQVEGLFGTDCAYTISCQKGAIADSVPIPSNVTVLYRD